MVHEILKARREKGDLDKKILLTQKKGAGGMKLEATIIGPRGIGIETGPQTIAIIQKLTIDEAVQIQDFVRGRQRLTRSEILEVIKLNFDFLESE